MLVLALAARAGRGQAKLELERYGQLREAERYQIDLAEKLYKERDYKAALAEFEKFIRIYQAKSVGSSYAQFMIGACNEHIHNVHTAIREYKAVADYFPRSPEAPLASLATGRCYDRLDDLKNAIAAYLETVKLFPNSDAASQALWGASEIARRSNQRSKCVEFRERIFQEYPKSSRRAWVAWWLARYYLLEQKDPEKARVFFRGLFEKPEDVEFAVAQNYHHINPHDHHQPTWAWGSSEFSPRSAYYAVRSRGTEQQKEGLQFADEAVNILRAVVKNFPESPRMREAWGLIPRVFFDTSRPAEAAAELRRYLDKYPDDDAQRSLLAECLIAMKRWDEARGEYARYANKYNGRWAVAESHRREGKPQQAVDAWTKMVTDFPDNAKRLLYEVGHTHQHFTRDYQRAIRAYTESEYNPPENLYRVGECYHAWGKREEAIKAYREIVTFFPDSGAEALKRIGVIYEELQMPKYAVAVFRRVCERYKQSSQASWAHQYLEEKYKIGGGGGVQEGTQVTIDWLEK